MVPPHAKGGIGRNQHKLKAKNTVEHVVHFNHKVGDLFGSLFCIFHNFRLLSSVDDQSNAVVCVSKITASKQQIFYTIKLYKAYVV